MNWSKSRLLVLAVLFVLEVVDVVDEVELTDDVVLIYFSPFFDL